jgi:hypothetical protein
VEASSDLWHLFLVRDCIIGGRDYAEFAAKVQAILAG